MKIRLFYGYFQVEVHAWWEWFLTTILDSWPIEFIAVTNRSHNCFKQFSVTKKFLLWSNWPLPAKATSKKNDLIPSNPIFQYSNTPLFHKPRGINIRYTLYHCSFFCYLPAMKTILHRICSKPAVLILTAFFFFLLSCSIPEPIETTVEKTTKTIKRTTRSITRTITLDDRDLQRTVDILNFENNSARESREFEEVFHKGLPEYINSSCPGVLTADPSTGSIKSMMQTPPKLKTGITDNYALTLIGRQLGLNAIVLGSLDDIRTVSEIRGVWVTKDTHYIVQVFIRVEMIDTRTATKILDNTFERQIEIDDIDYQMIKESDKISLPNLNETLNKLLTDVGDSICDTLRDQPWTGFITKIDGDKYLVSSGSRIGLKVGDVLEVFDSSRIIEGVGGQRFITPGLKIGEIEIVNTTEKNSEARLIEGKGIVAGSTVRRKD